MCRLTNLAAATATVMRQSVWGWTLMTPAGEERVGGSQETGVTMLAVLLPCTEVGIPCQQPAVPTSRGQSFAWLEIRAQALSSTIDFKSLLPETVLKNSSTLCYCCP